MNNLSPLEICSLIEYEKLRSFVELVSNGKRPDGTFNRCREALQIEAEALLKELKVEKQKAMELMLIDATMTKLDKA
jgi:hypothetical protein